MLNSVLKHKIIPTNYLLRIWQNLHIQFSNIISRQPEKISDSKFFRKWKSAESTRFAAKRLRWIKTDECNVPGPPSPLFHPREYHREITGTICSERGDVCRNGRPRWETTNTPIYHFRNGRFSVLHHFENRYSHYRGVSTGSNSSFPGIRGFRNTLAPIRLAREPVRIRLRATKRCSERCNTHCLIIDW